MDSCASKDVNQAELWHFLDEDDLIYGCIVESECLVEGNSFYSYNRKGNFITRTLSETFRWINRDRKGEVIYYLIISTSIYITLTGFGKNFLFYHILAL